MSDPGSDSPRLKAPPGTCDTHLHIYGPRDVYPVAPTAAAQPPLALLEEYRKVMARLGIARVVIVQPSAYGFDNRCTMDAVQALGAAARAVVVPPRDASDDDLARLTGAGARGFRFFMLAGTVLRWEELETQAARVQHFGWHVQVQFDGREFLERESLMKRLPGTVVIDHTGKFLEPVAPDHAAFKALLRFVESGRVWVKLSAPYETSKAGPPDYADVGALARALIKAAPERMLWATNWPHPGQAKRPDEGVLLDTLLHWCDDETVRRKILVDNPAKLYGFA
jgi:D-galactarolactone isomerase